MGTPTVARASPVIGVRLDFHRFDAVVGIRDEEHRPVVSALGDVLRHSRRGVAWQTRREELGSDSNYIFRTRPDTL
jgi:hypothetical protein